MSEEKNKEIIRVVQLKIRRAPFVAILIFVILGAIGISLKEPARVLQQATQICLSCIGIG